jgi:hypothetical protein
VNLDEIERAIWRGWIGVDGAVLREEDRKKARELVGWLEEIERAIERISKNKKLHIVDAAAGKAYTAALVQLLAPDRIANVRAIEREPDRVQRITEAAKRLNVSIDAIAGDVGDRSLWPDEPDLVVALHACGDASDRVIDRAAAVKARFVLIAPCCVAADLPSARRAADRAEKMGLPRAAEIRRPFIESLVMAERTLELEARGYHTEVVAFAPKTAHGVVLRAMRVGEPGRMRRSKAQLEAFTSAA